MIEFTIPYQRKFAINKSRHKFRRFKKLDVQRLACATLVFAHRMDLSLPGALRFLFTGYLMRRLLLLGLCLSCAVAGADSGGRSVPYGYDLRGHPVFRLYAAGDVPVRAVVVFFVATDCPVSNRYVPEIQRMEKEFSGRGVVFWLVYPNAAETAEGVVRHQTDFGLGGATLVHPTDRLMALAGATLTPEAVVLLADPHAARESPKRVYVGRIDDRYLDIGRERPRATRHDLEAAIEAALDHRTVPPPGGPPVGCGIVSEAAMRSGDGKP